MASQKALGELTTAEMASIVASWNRNTEHLSEDLKQWLADVVHVLSRGETSE